MNFETQVIELQARLSKIEAKIAELEEIANQVQGKLSESFTGHIDDLKQQQVLLTRHISAIEQDQVRSWEKSNLGNDLVNVARDLINRIDSLLSKPVDPKK